MEIKRVRDIIMYRPTFVNEKTINGVLKNPEHFYNVILSDKYKNMSLCNRVRGYFNDYVIRKGDSLGDYYSGNNHFISCANGCINCTFATYDNVVIEKELNILVETIGFSPIEHKLKELGL